MTSWPLAPNVRASQGGVAQLGERSVRNAEVVSSILIASTKNTGYLEAISEYPFSLCIQNVHTIASPHFGKTASSVVIPEAGKSQKRRN